MLIVVYLQRSLHSPQILRNDKIDTVTDKNESHIIPQDGKSDYRLRLCNYPIL